MRSRVRLAGVVGAAAVGIAALFALRGGAPGTRLGAAPYTVADADTTPYVSRRDSASERLMPHPLWPGVRVDTMMNVEQQTRAR